MEERYIKLMEPWMEKILNEYCSDGGKKLHDMADRIIRRNFIWLEQQYYDECYSIANELIYKLLFTHDQTKPFAGYLYSCLSNKIMSAITKTNTNSRRTKIEIEVVDEDGKVTKKKIPIPDVYMDAPIGEDGTGTMKDLFSSDFNLENEIGYFQDEKVEMYLSGLSKIQRQIVEMKMEDVSVFGIKEKLQISNSEYEDSMKAIKENKLINLFNKHNSNIKKQRKQENMQMEQKVIINEEDLIMDLDTTDNHSSDKRSLESLLEDKMGGELDCNYISQRAPFQWSEEQINKYYSRILNNQPIPEVVVCEIFEDGNKISYLVEGLQRLSYAEEFKKNRLPVKSKGAEFTKVRYKKYEYNESGKTKILDDNGRAKYTIDVFDITDKFYKDLPEHLQKRFDDFNITVTRYFNCTYEIIDYHIRNYNNHEGMTKSHYGITSVSNNTSTNIKSISQKHPFFINNVQCTNKGRKKGVLEDIVARSMMTIFFINDWKKELIDTLKFIDKNANDKQFEHFKNNIDRLECVADKSVKELFNTTNGCVWLAVFDKFAGMNIQDIKFVEFMREFKESKLLHSKVVNGRSYNDIDTRNTKDKTTVKNKIEMLVDLMLDYFQVESLIKEPVNVLDFVKENANPEATEEDIMCYEEDLDGLTLDVNNSSKLLDEQNHNSLMGIIAYSYKADIVLDNWVVDYFDRHGSYIIDQKQNYLHMKSDLDNYIETTKDTHKQKTA